MPGNCFPAIQSRSFPVTDYSDISSWEGKKNPSNKPQPKTHISKGIVCKRYREWTTCLFLHICLQSLSLGPSTKRGERQKTPKKNHKGNTRQEPDCSCKLWAEGDIENMGHSPHHLGWAEDLALLPLHTVRRLQTRSLTGQHALAASTTFLGVSYRIHFVPLYWPVFCNQKSMCNPKAKLLWLPPQGCHTELHRRRQKKSSHRLHLPHIPARPSRSLSTCLGVSFSI